MTPGAAALHAAITAGDADRVRALLADDPGLAAARGDDGVSALARAAYHRQGEVLDLLLAAGAPLDVFDAAIAGREARVWELVAADPDLARAWSADGFTALHLAAFFGHTGCVRALLAAGADPAPAARNPMGVAPLHAAAARHSAEIAELLLAAGAGADARQPGGFTALMSAGHAGERELAEVLLAHGADPALRDDEGRTAADHARAAGHAELAARLGG